jgi:GNAT superfamily N-acetyltransferase
VKSRRRSSRLEIVPLTSARWRDFERLFGPNGACGGCWCMTPRLTRREYEAGKGEPNRRAMRRIVADGSPPGLLAYRGGEPIAWIAVGPRREYRLLAGSRILAPVDDRPVWSIVCLYLRKDARRQGLSAELIRAAARFARARGAQLVEGYPQDPKRADMPPVFAWTGFASAFERAGFAEVARRSPTRPIVRWPAPASTRTSRSTRLTSPRAAASPGAPRTTKRPPRSPGSRARPPAARS